MSGRVDAYLPFRGLSAWFSSSVRPCMAKKWDEFGGCFAAEDKADFLFSDNSYSVDTVRIYETQPGVTVFQSVWLSEVVKKRCTVHDIPLGRYLVLPHYLVQKVCSSGDPFKTPRLATLMQLHKERRGRSGSSGVATNTSLSQLLANREKRRESQHSHNSDNFTRLKNSREHHTSQVHLAQLEGGVERGRHENERDGGVKISEGGENVGVRDTLAVWDQLLQQSQTTCLSKIHHIDSMKQLDHKLLDFDPCLSHFTMRRKL